MFLKHLPIVRGAHWVVCHFPLTLRVLPLFFGCLVIRVLFEQSNVTISPLQSGRTRVYAVPPAGNPTKKFSTPVSSQGPGVSVNPIARPAVKCNSCHSDSRGEQWTERRKPLPDKSYPPRLAGTSATSVTAL